MIMYTLLAGSPPFWHRKQMLMLRMILAGNYQFTSPEWDDRSDTVKDLVCSELYKGEQDATQGCVKVRLCAMRFLNLNILNRE